MVDDVLGHVLDSTDATVGGGSAAALAGAMAAGLAGMVARLSMGRGLGLNDERYLAIVDETHELGRDLHAGARQDAEAYGLVRAAYGLPRDGEEAIAVRQAAINTALQVAAAVPLENARRALRVRRLCAELDGVSNPAAGSDLAAAVLLGEAAVVGCLLNVEVNALSLPDSPATAQVRRDAEAVRESLERESVSPKETA